MKKQQLISKIKYSLQAHSLNIGEDTFQDCPIHKTISKDEHILIETIYSDKVSCTHYVHGNDINTYFLEFEQISNTNLQLILDNVLEANEYFND
jgi:hypothetical protein